MSDIEALARQLQAVGPDEYPSGYYLWLAERMIEEENSGNEG